MTQSYVVGTVQELIDHLERELRRSKILGVGGFATPMPEDGVPQEWYAEIIQHFSLTRKVSFDNTNRKIVFERLPR